MELLDKETKFFVTPFSIDCVEEKSDAGLRFGVVKGLASPTGNIDHGRDRVMRGAFKDTIAEHLAADKQIKMMDGHFDLIGGWPIFKETRKGLEVEGNINLDVQKGIEAYALAKQKVLTDLSIGYRATEVEYVTDEIEGSKGEKLEIRVRNIKKLKIYEVSLVPFPMNEEANITSIKSCESITDISKFLKSLGVSNKDANEIIFFMKKPVRNDTSDDEKADSRNEVIKKIDGMKMSMEFDSIFNKLKRR